MSKESFSEWFVDEFGTDIPKQVEGFLKDDTKRTWNYQQQKLDQKDAIIKKLMECVELGDLFRNRIKLFKSSGVVKSDYLDTELTSFDKTLKEIKESD
tara:strand:- start:11086 stop:11379 length:294 start_codon:yes stop_codon:yes gene_type:complete